jgi:hypothetical protein
MQRDPRRQSGPWEKRDPQKASGPQPVRGPKRKSGADTVQGPERSERAAIGQGTDTEKRAGTGEGPVRMERGRGPMLVRGPKVKSDADHSQRSEPRQRAEDVERPESE